MTIEELIEDLRGYMEADEVTDDTLAVLSALCMVGLSMRMPLDAVRDGTLSADVEDVAKARQRYAGSLVDAVESGVLFADGKPRSVYEDQA